MAATRRSEDLIGQRFGRLTVLLPVWFIKRRQKAWLCSCDCGSATVVLTGSLRRGCTKSCGCLQREQAGTQRLTHGQRHSRTYESWKHMKSRCSNPNYQYFASYGGRGIAVCERWEKFENFLADMGERPPGKSLDRIDNEKGYCPENCRWATHSEQMKNRRKFARKRKAAG